MSIQQENFKEIADKIREKIGSEGLIKPSEFANKIDDVYEAGKQANSKEWWTKYFSYRNNAGFHYAFCGWSVKAYTPSIAFGTIKGSDGMFRQFNQFGEGDKRVDLVALHAELGIPDIDWSTATASCYQTFYNSRISHLGVVDLSKATHTQFFTNAVELVTIDEVKLNPSASYTSLFNGCSKLANIKFGSEIPKSISFSPCPLTLESAIDIINHLKNFNDGEHDDEYGIYTITFNAATWELLDAVPEEETPGLAYRNYIQDIGWNY